LILHIVGFANLQIMGFDPREGRPRYLAICIALFGFFMQATMWLMTYADD
jgi:hypothetical protein